MNLEACTEIARQIRLRNLAGHIVIDFVPLRKRPNRTKLLDRLHQHMADDLRRVQMGGFTRFGLIELTRQRHGLSLAHRMNARCGMCGGSGRTKSAVTAAHEALRAAVAEARHGIDRRPKITAGPSVIATLAKDAAPALRETEDKLGRRIILVEDPTISSQMFTVTLAGDQEE